MRVCARVHVRAYIKFLWKVQTIGIGLGKPDPILFDNPFRRTTSLIRRWNHKGFVCKSPLVHCLIIDWDFFWSIGNHTIPLRRTQKRSERFSYRNGISYHLDIENLSELKYERFRGIGNLNVWKQHLDSHWFPLRDSGEQPHWYSSGGLWCPPMNLLMRPFGVWSCKLLY